MGADTARRSTLSWQFSLWKVALGGSVSPNAAAEQHQQNSTDGKGLYKTNLVVMRPALGEQELLALLLWVLGPNQSAAKILSEGLA